MSHIRRRRADLCAEIDVVRSFEQWEESCVPSYCHPNWAAAGVSWIRLFRAAKLARRFVATPRRILDFGSSVGELGHLVSANGTGYDFIEEDRHSAEFLKSRLPAASQVTLESAPDRAYDQLFAIDSLEHNRDYAALLERLVAKLAPSGILILSGPTESGLYRLGRRIAGFDGHYHETTIHEIEAVAARLLRRRAVSRVMPLAPLFRVTAWTHD